jgi:hypothetical protein
VTGIDRVLEPGEHVDFDYYIHMMSIPRVLGTTLDAIPSGVPYVRSSADRLGRIKLEPAQTSELKVGIAWAGNPDHPKDSERSIDFETLRPLFDVERVRFYSLQKGMHANALKDTPQVIDLDPRLADFSDTAAVIEQLDLTICVDTSVAHLAGAMGKPTWLLLPTPCDWRWLNHGATSPWYPTMRIFRQTSRHDWATVIAETCAALVDLREGCKSDPLGSSGHSRGGEVVDLAQSPRLHFGGVAETRFGILQYVPDGSAVAASLPLYGEYLSAQLRFLSPVLPAGSVVLEIGASIGAHTLPLANKVGNQGHVFAWESDAVRRHMLVQNVSANRCQNVTILTPNRANTTRGSLSAVVNETGSASLNIDELQLDKLSCIKATIDEWDVSILSSAADTIWRFRPAVLTTCADEDSLDAAKQTLDDFGYVSWRVSFPLFEPDNFNRATRPSEAAIEVMSIFSLPEERDPPEGMCIGLARA